MPPRSEDTPSVQMPSVDFTAHVDFLREGLRLLVQNFIEMEISDVIEAVPHERSSNRRSYRNGYRRRTWMTSLGELTLEIPKLRKGTYYPAFFESVRQSESFLIDSLRQIYKNGVTARDVEKIVDTIGLNATQPDQIAEMVEQLYNLVDRFRDKSRLRYTDNLSLYRPVNAISTRVLNTDLSDEQNLPRSLYMGSLHMGQVDDWLTESLDVLIRVHHALSDQVDAVAA